MSPKTALEKFLDDDSDGDVGAELTRLGYRTEDIEAAAHVRIRRFRSESRLARGRERLAWFREAAQRIRKGLEGREIAHEFEARFGPIPVSGPISLAYRRLDSPEASLLESRLDDLYVLMSLADENSADDPDAARER